MTLALRILRHGSTIEGVTAPNATVEVENLSVAPYAPTTTALVTRTKADSLGKFRLPAAAVRAGDVLRVSASGAAGQRTLDVIADATGSARRPEVEVQGLRLTAERGRLTVRNVLSNPKIAAPGTVLRFVSGTAEVRYVVSDTGLAPDALPIAAKPGDDVDVFVDVAGKRAKKRWATLTVGGGAGAPSPERDSKKAALVPAIGALFVDGVDVRDARQGDVGDCWIIATLKAIAFTRPQALKDMIIERADGSYLVKLQRWSPAKKAFESAAPIVPPLLYAANGALTYGSSRTPKELWPAIIERAYAQEKGSYDAIAVGYPYAAFEATLGVKGSHTPFDAVDDEAIWRSVLASKKRATLAVTRPPKSQPFKAARLVEDHAYAVLGGREQNGERFVTLGNPWGEFEPAGDGEDDGIFELSLADYRKFFAYSCAANV